MKKYSLAIAFIIMLVGGVALGYVYNERPEKVVGESIRSLRDARSLMAAVTVGTFAPETVVRAAGADPNLVLLPIVFVGEVGMNIPADQPVSGTATFEIIGENEEGKAVTFHVVIGEDGMSYVQFENIPEEKTSANVVEQLNGKWYSMRSRGLAALLAKDGEATLAQEDPTGKAPVEAWARVRETVSNGELFGRPVAQGTQRLGAVSASKYELPFKHDVLVRVAQDIKTMVRGRALTDDERAEVAMTMQNREVSLQIWVERKTKRLLQANLDVKTLGLEPGDKEPRTSLLSLLARFTSWNEPVEVKVPEESQPFGDLIERLKAK